MGSKGIAEGKDAPVYKKFYRGFRSIFGEKFFRRKARKTETESSGESSGEDEEVPTREKRTKGGRPSKADQKAAAAARKLKNVRKMSGVEIKQALRNMRDTILRTKKKDFFLSPVPCLMEESR